MTGLPMAEMTWAVYLAEIHVTRASVDGCLSAHLGDIGFMELSAETLRGVDSVAPEVLPANGCANFMDSYSIGG